MKVALLVWIALSAAGAALLVAPDHGERIVSFSDDHGLTPLDAAGVLLLVAGWAAPVTVALRARPRVRLAHVVLAVIGALVLFVAIANDLGALWVGGAALLGAVQLALFVDVARR